MLVTELETSRFILTAPRESDIPRITQICQDPTIQKWTTVPAPYTEADAQFFVDDAAAKWEAGQPVWFARTKSSADGTPGEVVACVDLHASRAGTAELGYWCAPDARGTGVVPEICRAALNFGFQELGLQVVRWSCEIHDGEVNWASAKVAWKLGFTFEGRRRGGVINKGRAHDCLDGSLAAGEPMEPREPWCGPDPRHPAFGDPHQPELLVRQFHEVYGLPIVEDTPNVDRERVHMRMSLIAEEFIELTTAVYGPQAGEKIATAVQEARALDDGSRDTVEAADALADLTYVIYGMALEMGIPMARVLAAVQASNLSKLGADGKPIYREDGKVLKGPNFFDPDIAGALGL
ncbi:Protein N-acetyltransferase, RimJ/RimL family [Actinobaculum suis]|uniref:GNAT family N-acetyltransferase n=1 Tax=Actinobaculum suis TaxID=1657 RepID=A0A0K9ES04_9ACTO|nr:GNAT family N-acetyltransferase [Actinobaculum suis]KMY22660.1 acetyltransferase [Actinobaculum suis]MDY5153051.1 GNAT family N-acetyltransferase [Actinobaculum suis]SDE61170.1 Protein N-acetyltransferase, RimJ/RimL family [Actinobaculum suis]